MKGSQVNGPQQSLLYRVTAFISRLRFRYLIRRFDNRRILTALFVFSAGATAIGIITSIAYLTELPLLFPPLGPSAFILFHSPLSQNACPRSVILSHSIAVAAGLFSLWLVGVLGTEVQPADDGALNWNQVAAIVCSIGLISVSMLLFNCIHAPAAATALIAAMGYVGNLAQAGGLIGAVILLALEGVFFNRVLGGLPYPFWRFDPAVVKNYHDLSGHTEYDVTFWQRLTAKTFQERR